MTKTTITKSWIGGLAVFAAGVILAIVGVFLMLAYGGTFNQVPGSSNNYDFTPTLNGFFWTTVGLIVTGGVIGLIGGLVQLVVWIGGLVRGQKRTDGKGDHLTAAEQGAHFSERSVKLSVRTGRGS